MLSDIDATQPGEVYRVRGEPEFAQKALSKEIACGTVLRKKLDEFRLLSNG